MEIPKYVRYDFLSTIIGLFLASIAFYYRYLQKSITVSNDVLNLILIISIPFIIYGMGQMFNNYRLDNDNFILRSIVDRKNYIDKLEGKELLNKKQQTDLTKDIKNELKDFIDRKTEEIKSNKKSKRGKTNNP